MKLIKFGENFLKFKFEIIFKISLKILFVNKREQYINIKAALFARDLNKLCTAKLNQVAPLILEDTL